MHWYMVCFSLSDWLHAIWQSLGPSMSLQMTGFCYTLWLSNIPLCVCIYIYMYVYTYTYTCMYMYTYMFMCMYQFSAVQSLSRVWLCNPMNRSMPGLPVHHQLRDFTQTHVHRVSDAIQASHPLLSPSPPAPNPSQDQGLFQWVNSSHEVAKVLEFQL